MRDTLYERNTKETEIKLRLDLDGSGTSRIETGIGFFDHMLTAFALHAGFSLELQCRGDLNVDTHHTVEDIGIALGQAVSRILDDKREIARYGNFLIPMDEALAQCTVDISGRPFLVFHADFKAEKIGELETQTIGEFFRAFAMNAGITLHINLLYGDNDHHKAEAIFKAFGHAMRLAVQTEEGRGILSTKGMLA